MVLLTDAPLGLETESEGLEFARSVLRIEAEALERVRARLDGSIARAAGIVYRCRGSVIVTGMGKAGLVGQKLASTLASTGTRAFPLHRPRRFMVTWGGSAAAMSCWHSRRAARPTRCSGWYRPYGGSMPS